MGPGEKPRIIKHGSSLELIFREAENPEDIGLGRRDAQNTPASGVAESVLDRAIFVLGAGENPAAYHRDLRKPLALVNALRIQAAKN
jgi:hypothetical protein